MDATALFDSAFYGRIGGNLTNSLKIDRLNRFQANGSINALVDAQYGGNDFYGCYVVAGSISSSGHVCIASPYSGSLALALVKTSGDCDGDIEAQNGSIGVIEVGGDLSGQVMAEQGGIVSIEVDGVINSANVNGNFPIRAKAGIDSITALSISANITTIVNTGTGIVHNIRTADGNISGNIHLRALTAPVTGDSGIVINGDLTGTIRFFTGSTATELISIAGALSGTIDFDDSASLSPQIIVNAGNQSATWSGNVLIGSTTINSGASQPNQAPYYNATSSALGGGAVGLAPFHLHDTDCSPVNGGNISGGFNAPNEVTLAFYGPIRQTPSTTYPVQIRYFDGTWHTIDGDDFFYSISGRSLIITALTSLDFDSQVTYEITPTNLQCVGVSGTPSVASFTYTIMAE